MSAAAGPYSAFSFTAEADLADGSGRWPTSFGVTELGDEPADTSTTLVKKAMS